MGLLGDYEDSDEDENAPSILAQQSSPAAASGGGSAEGTAKPGAGAAEAATPAPSPLVAASSGSSPSMSPEGDGIAEDTALPPSPVGEPDPDVLENVKKLHSLRSKGKRILDELTARKWSNPYALEKVMEVFKIDQYSSNYPKQLFDPSKVVEHPSDYYDAPECERPEPPKQ
eukprot:CAMPEP_0178443852 /NCGR_PEP_ID=MMETSP0689_2-20121128/39143_1 /TAXON_ID=160604 /ORGANISM="Amphidinium massartii, Strain CS-259" /LENGTH=171 /DNA_ID=CAMNT_0020067941 /DNA_START=9 /DNA_END=521 /DNA_ORIENTATION=-